MGTITTSAVTLRKSGDDYYLRSNDERIIGDFNLNSNDERIIGDFNLNSNAERILGVFYWDKNQGDLRVDLTEPEKAFDWIRIIKILGSIQLNQTKVLEYLQQE